MHAYVDLYLEMFSLHDGGRFRKSLRQKEVALLVALKQVAAVQDFRCWQVNR